MAKEAKRETIRQLRRATIWKNIALIPIIGGALATSHLLGAGAYVANKFEDIFFRDPKKPAIVEELEKAEEYQSQLQSQTTAITNTPYASERLNQFIFKARFKEIHELGGYLGVVNEDIAELESDSDVIEYRSQIQGIQDRREGREKRFPMRPGYALTSGLCLIMGLFGLGSLEEKRRNLRKALTPSKRKSQNKLS